MKTKIDWTKGNHEIANQLGKGYSYVYQLRKALKQPSRPVGAPSSLDPAKVAKVDWSQSDRAVSEFLCCSLQTAWRLRRKLGKKPLARGRRWETKQ